MNCTVCGEDVEMQDISRYIRPSNRRADLHHRCEMIMTALNGLGNTPARELLHKINTFIATGVDD